jgi:uncharacterized protein YbjT (DUF2867 family)
MLPMDDNTILVLGGTGKTGRRIVGRLRALDVPVRVGSRSLPFDWYDASTWDRALDDVSAVYVSFFPDLAVEGAPAIVGAFARLAAQRGVERLVLLSGRGEPRAQRAEREVIAAGTQATVVRCSWFAQNFSEAFLAGFVKAGEIALPGAEVPEPFVDAEDIAEVAVAALTQDGHDGRVYELTGPRALRFDEAAAELSAATGSEIRFVPVPAGAFHAQMLAAGVPAAEADLVSFLFREVLDGRNAEPQDGVFRALGRAPRDFGEYARVTAASGAWS